MNIADLLSELRRNDVALWPEDGELCYSAPPGAMSPALRAKIAEAKPELLSFLNDAVSLARSPPSLVSSADDTPAPLSFNQEWFWLLDELDDDKTNYIIPLILRLDGALSVSGLAAALSAVVGRHAVLRTRIVAGSAGPVQMVTPVALLDLPVTDLSAFAPGAREAAVAAAQLAEAMTPFDLSVGPILRARLLRLEAEAHILLLTVHHIAFDDWSLGVLFRELAVLYPAYANGTQPVLAAPSLSYTDYARWQRGWLDGPTLATALGAWRSRLAGAPPVLDLPTDRPRPAALTGTGALLPLRLPATLVTELRQLSRREGVTLFMTLLAGFQIVLSRWSGQADIVVGVPVAGRTEAALEDLIGCFINTLVMRAELPGGLTVRQALARVREASLAGYAHQALPFMRLVEALAPARDASHTPLVQVGFDLHNTPAPELRLGALQVTPQAPVHRGAKLDLFLILEETPAGELVGGLEYRPALFEAATVSRLAGHLETVLRGMAAAPQTRLAALPLLTAAEREELLVTRNATAVAYPVACVHELISAQAARTPTAPAVIAADAELSFAQLEARANQLAWHLQALGVRRQTRVAVCLDRSAALAVALLGILKAGGAFVPLDPSFPSDRIGYVLDDSAATVLLTQASQLDHLPRRDGLAVLSLDADWPVIASHPTAPPPCPAGPDDLCYLIYTSGSTGRPKGVLIAHRPVANHAVGIVAAYALGGGDRVLQFAGPGFDVAIEEMLPSWSAGAAVVMPAMWAVGGIDELQTVLRTAAVTVANLPTPFWQEWVAALRQSGGMPLPALRLVVIGSDRAAPEQIDHWQSLHHPPVPLINAYGVSEATITSLLFRIPATRGESPRLRDVPIGLPIANTRAYVLDDSLEPVPVGGNGELYLGGDGLARGYLNDPALTAARFLPDPFASIAGGRLYRTGDLVRQRADGPIEFLGRRDHQVKIRGYRVEPGEIEAALATHPTVREAVVLALPDSSGERCLVGCLVPATDAGVPDGDRDLRRHLRASLPAYMVPSAFVRLDRLPLTPNGKLDRAALAALAATAGRGAGSDDHMPPRTPMEELVASVWAEVLRIERVGRQDDFFALGGHSLLATRVLARLRGLLGRSVAMRTLFEAPTLAGLAAALDSPFQGESEPPPLVAEPPAPAGGRVPLTLEQRPFWDLYQRVPDSPNLTVHGSFDLRGCLNAAAFATAVGEIVRRHAVLRTTIAGVPEPLQTVHPPQPSSPLELIDLSGLTVSGRAARVARNIAAAVAQPFDLGKSPLLRARLLCLGQTRHVLLLAVPHIAFDGWSLSLLLEELAALYAELITGRLATSPGSVRQYADYARHQQARLAGGALADERDFWRRQLADGPAFRLPPTDRPRTTPRSFRYRRLNLVLADPIYSGLKKIAEAEGASLFMVCIAAFMAFQRELLGQTDLWVAALTAGRGSIELERVIGCFVNTIVLRVDLAGCTTPCDMLRRVRHVALDAYGHQEVPFVAIAEAAGLEAGVNFMPPIPALFNFERAPVSGGFDLPGLTIARLTPRPQPVDEVEVIPSLFDFIVDALDDGDQIDLMWKYNDDLYDADTGTRFLARYHELLTMYSDRPLTRVLP